MNVKFALSVTCTVVFHTRICLLYSEEVAALGFNIFSLTTGSFIRDSSHIILFE
jgi:hypothetical protein